MKKILTKHDPPPIPDRSLDWSAWVDGQDEDVTGWGATESEAIAELEAKLAEEE